ncbi:unnamed protein product [Sphagnum balticum]
MEQENCRQRSGEAKLRWNRVVTQSLTDGFLLTITLWRDMTMSDRRVFLATSGRHRQLYVEATHDEL